MKKYILFLFIAFSAAYESDAQDSLATVFFYKPGKVGQPFAEYVAFHGDRALGRVRQGKFFNYRCKPGDQTFSASNDAGAGSVTISAEPGVWYFVRCDLAEGKPSFVKVDTKTAENEMYKINPGIANELATHTIPTRIPLEMVGSTAQNDTLRAISNLFRRKRNGGTARAIVFGILTLSATYNTLRYQPSTVTIKQGSSTQTIPISEPSPPISNYVVIGFTTIMTITGVTQATKYNDEAAHKALSDYKDGKPLPVAIKKKFKKKDFK